MFFSCYNYCVLNIEAVHVARQILEFLLPLVKDWKEHLKCL